MGLDVTAVSKIQRQTEVTNYEEGERLGYKYLYRNPDFAERAPEIMDGWYSFADCCRGISRSYGGYNIWRNQLAELAGYPVNSAEKDSHKRSHAASAWTATSGPFWELINFADNEGAIGAAVAAKLAKDFAEFQEKADAHSDAMFRDGYVMMRNAFELAADGGCVDFG